MENALFTCSCGTYAGISGMFMFSMILSRSAVDRIISRDRKCPRDDYPDDMFLGTTAKALDITVVSSSLFHQVR